MKIDEETADKISTGIVSCLNGIEIDPFVRKHLMDNIASALISAYIAGNLDGVASLVMQQEKIKDRKEMKKYGVNNWLALKRKQLGYDDE